MQTAPASVSIPQPQPETAKKPAPPAAKEKMPSPESRRVHARVEIEIPVGPGTSAQLYGGLAMNVSQGGVYIRTRTTLKMGDVFSLDLRLGSKFKLVVQAVTRWIERGPDGNTIGVGLQFVDLTERQEFSLQQYVNDNLDEVMQR